MSVAERAVANAIPIEVKKDGLQQRQNGDWVLRLVVQAADMDQRVTTAPMGTRYQAVLVEVNDDETPKEQPKSKLDWRDVQPAAQAGIRCAEPRFRDYLAVEHGINTKTAQEAAEAVRNLCGVNSRAMLGVNHKARALWHSIDSGYRSWAHL
jgi:hypothetical protein